MTTVPPTTPRRSPLFWILAGAGGLFAFVCLCLVGLTVLGKNTPTPTAIAQRPAAASTLQATPTAVAATAVAPTDAPAVAPTAAPTAEPPTELPTIPPLTVTPALSAIGAVGERREAGGIALTVAKVEHVAKLGDFQKAKAGNEFIIAEVILETTGRDKAPYNPFYFKVKDGDGFEYTTALNIQGNALKSGELGQGEKVRGTVAFEVKKDVAGLVLSYEPIVILGGYEPIKVALE
jgi:hypothetical protein